MKQKDKKKGKTRPDRLRTVKLPDLDILDDTREQAGYKTLRTASKQHDMRKDNMELVTGRIAEIKSNYNYVVETDGVYRQASLSGRLKQFTYASKTISAVGDVVELDLSNAPDYRIENILPRRNTLSRYAEGSFQKEIILAANIDQVIITSSWKKPLIKLGLIDRYLCIAALQDLDAVIVINKADLREVPSGYEESLDYYQEAGYTVLNTSAVTGAGMGELKEVLKDRDSVFSGQSGTGKSTLINWLEPELNLPTAEVSDYNEKGKHTTTQTILIPWSFGGHLLDTPGIKTIALHRDSRPEIPRIFPGFDRWAPQCRFRDCSHTHEEDCAVLRALEEDLLPIERYDSYLRIMESL
ncbi:MAG: ribosome small subunit-dependent GTPase A [Candidatus Syntrophosphaera sp.]